MAELAWGGERREGKNEGGFKYTSAARLNPAKKRHKASPRIVLDSGSFERHSASSITSCDQHCSHVTSAPPATRPFSSKILWLPQGAR